MNPSPGSQRSAHRVGPVKNADGRRISGPVLFVGVAVVYAALAQFVIHLNDPVNLGAGLWLASGFALAVLVKVEPRRWLWVLAGVVVAEVVGDLAHGYPAGASLWWAVANCIEPVVGAGLLRRWGFTNALTPIRQLVQFLLAAVLIAPVVGGSVSSVGTVFALGSGGWWQVWPTFVIEDAVGVLVVAPLLLWWGAQHDARGRVETATLVTVLPVVSIVSFHPWGGHWVAGLPYLVIPLLTWAALRYGRRGAAVGVFTVTMIATWSTAIGEGPFVHFAAANGQAITLLQGFLVVAALSTFVLAAIVEDLADRAAVETGLQIQASTDSLTGLPNRTAMASVLTELEAFGLSGVGLLVCDLDHFKVVNDGLGHHAGDEVLVEVGRRLRKCVRPRDLVARLGGDEFVVIVDSGSGELAELARRLIAAVSEPLTLSDGTKLTPSISVGIAHSGPGGITTSLLREADAALYRAKSLGRSRSHRFDEQLHLQVVDRLLIQTDLKDALAAGELYCVYQPEIVIASGELFGFETLARWDHSTRGSIPPDRFIPVIEEIGAAGELFEHVLAEGLRAQAQWAKRLGFHPAVAVNASATQLGDLDLANIVARALTKVGAPASSLWIEVTESALVDEEAMGRLLAVHDLGVLLAIDDFGTGWSSMARLAGFPWDMVKIDRSFVAALGTDRPAEQVVKSTIAMAHALGILTTAEGVETTEQLDRLAELDCDVAQGFLIGRPAPARDAIALVGDDGHWRGPGVPAHLRRSS